MASNQIMLQPLPAGKFYSGFFLHLQHATDISLLPDEHEIVLNVETGHYMIVNWDKRILIADGQFSSQEELRFILHLLDKWPSYVPNAMLLQVVNEQSASEVVQLLDATRDQALTMLHKLAENCRRQLRPYGIEIQNISGQGYKLSRYARGGHAS